MHARHLLRTLVVALVAVGLSPVGILPASAQGRVLHVSPDGEDPDTYVCHVGTEDRPWNNIADAFRCVAPGDTILVHEGTYREVVQLGDNTSPGREDAPILVTGAPGEGRPVIMGSLRVENADWWTIQDLEIVGDPDLDYDAWGDPPRTIHPLKMVGGHRWTVQRVHVHDAATYGLVRIEMRDGYAPATDWRFLDSCVHDTHPAHGSPDTAPYTDHNLYVNTGPGGSGLIEGNVIFGAPNGQNIKLGNSSGDRPSDATDDVVVRHNTLVDAAQNVTVVGPSNGNVIERNILAEVNYGDAWYPNVRGIHLHGTGNVARDNAWSGAAQVVHNQTGNTTEVADGGNRQVSPGFSSRGCDGFAPSDPDAAAYGANPRDLSHVDIPVERVAGENRIATSIEVAQRVHDSAEVAIVARGDAYPDALASSALAGLEDAPVLLSARDHVPPAVLEELERLGTQRVVLLGGEAALDRDVADDLRSAGLAVSRVAGESRFETATAVADLVVSLKADGMTPRVGGPRDEVLLVEGVNADPRRGWPDAVSAGQLAAASGVPVLLTESTRLPEETRAWLAENRPDRVTVVGGPVAVSDGVVDEVASLGGKVRRIAGDDRYATAEAVAMELSRRRGSSTPSPRVYVASGHSFPDAMAVGPAAASTDGVVVLYAGGQEAYERLRAFVDPIDPRKLDVTVVGGTLAVPGTLEERWALDASSG